MSTQEVKKFKAHLEALERVRQQREWIDKHGGNVSGYVLRYGSAADPNHIGDGGEAIYAADVETLRRYEEEAR